MPFFPGRVTAQLVAQLEASLGPEYRIEQELDGGGMSRLFLTTDLRHNRKVVVKVLPPELVTETSTARFRREIELTVKLQHPHILPILTSGSWDDVLYYITPFIPGESLRARIARDKKLPLDDIVKILRDVSGALAFAHQRGIVHRDVKPGNILLADGHAILADFGIARAVVTDATPITTTGLSPGTPAYMAPELPTDESADVYALGIVGCEMLSGRLPSRGLTAKDLVSSRGNVPGDSRRTLDWVATILEAAISISPAQRADIAAFQARLATQPTTYPKRRVIVAIAATAATILAAVALWPTFSATHAKAKPESPFVILPFVAADPADSVLASLATARVRDAFAEWREDTLIDQGIARDAWVNASRRPTEVRDAIAMAHKLGASTLVWGNVERRGSDRANTTVSVTMYAVRTGDPIATTSREYSVVSDTAARTAARTLASVLLRGSDDLPWHDARDLRTASLAAWRHYDAGQAALHVWGLPEAEREFRSAIAIDPDLPQANLWLAQSLYWQLDRQKRDDRRSAGKRGFALRSTLRGRDSLFALAIGALSDSDFPAACVSYRAMTVLDPGDVFAWLGIADCQGRDAVVVADASSPSGWRFRASFVAAERALLRVASLAPGTMDPNIRGWLLARLREVDDVETMRYGSPLSGGEPLFARPYLNHDTLVFIPYPTAVMARGGGFALGTARDSAVNYSHEILLNAAEQWVRKDGQNASAWFEFARTAEAAGGATLRGQPLTAVEVAQRAHGLARDSATRIGLAVMETRLLLKASEFTRAAATADSALRSGAAKKPGIAGVAGLAALLGRGNQTADLLVAGAQNDFGFQIPGGKVTKSPPPIAASARRLLAFAALGGSLDSVRANLRRIDENIPTYISDAEAQRDVRASIHMRSLLLLYPEEPSFGSLVRDLPQPPNLRIRAQIDYAKNDRSSAFARVDTLREQSRLMLPGATFVDATHRRAELALALGDTTGAIADMDRTLSSLGTANARILDDVPQIGALVRIMIRRAELADVRGDRTTARRWASVVTTLWANADPALQPLVRRMRTIQGR